MTGKFTFATREEGFDEHIDTSIRGYNDMWNDVVDYSQYFVEDYTSVVDIGCSTGKMLKYMIAQNTFAPNAQYTGVEIEEAFWSTYEQDTKDYLNLDYHQGNANDFHFYNCSYVTSIFTLQFMSHQDRSRVINSVFQGLNPGGAFVFAEKTMPENVRVHEMRTFTYYDYKRRTFTSDDILDKERQLRHMTKPNTREEIFDMCRAAGFTAIDTFWQNHAFTGFIALKSPLTS
jgi:tRNA (cmo5U34)-methyltransferase